MISNNVKIKAQDLNVYYGKKQALFNVNLDIHSKEVTALIGPSGCGKSTFIRCINRMNDVIDICKIEGSIKIDDKEIIDNNIDVVRLRESIGMVFQKPNPFPKSIYDNISYGPSIHGLADNKSDMDQIVENSLKKAALWEEVKDRLDEPGTGLSGGQQQRLCIARAISVNPEVILMDEPCSALDPIATAKIEELIDELKKSYTIVIVTHSMSQAVRVSQRTGFFHLGKIIEVDTTAENIIKNDAKINELRATIEEQIVNVLVKRAPMAIDLRLTISTLKISSDLERIGDLAKSVAKKIKPLPHDLPEELIASLRRLGDLVQRQLKDILDAYLKKGHQNVLLKNLDLATHLLFVTKNIERAGDHITNIAESLFYLIEGEHIEGARPKGKDFDSNS